MKATFLSIWDAMEAECLNEAQATAPATGQQQQGRFSQAAVQQLQQLSQTLPNFMKVTNDPNQMNQQLPGMVQMLQQLLPTLQGWQQEMQATMPPPQQSAATVTQPQQTTLTGQQPTV